MDCKRIGSFQNLLELPEDIILEAIDKVPTDERKEIDSILAAATVYREADMTPMFLMDVSTYDIYCVAKETFGKKLH